MEPHGKSDSQDFRNGTDVIFDSEIQAHLDFEADEFKKDGLDEDEARNAALRKFGNVTIVRERFYESGRWVGLRFPLSALCRKLLIFRSAPIFGFTAGQRMDPYSATLNDSFLGGCCRQYLPARRLSRELWRDYGFLKPQARGCRLNSRSYRAAKSSFP